MIAFVRGERADITEDNVVLDVGGIGYNIKVSTQTAQRLPGIGKEAMLHTYTCVREDAFQLFGFLTRDELSVFKKLITVNGIGPKGGLAILSVMSADDLRFAIISGDAKAIAEYKLEGFRRDTIWVSLMDSLYKGQNLNVDSMRYIPFSEGDTFEIIACPNTTKSGAIVQVMECNASIASYLKGMGKLGDRMIKNKTLEADEMGRYAGLKIGEAGDGWNNNAGNWE